MRITLEGSGLDEGRKVMIEIPENEAATIEDILDDLIKPALLAWEYHPDSVNGIYYEHPNLKEFEP